MSRALSQERNQKDILALLPRRRSIRDRRSARSRDSRSMIASARRRSECIRRPSEVRLSQDLRL